MRDIHIPSVLIAQPEGDAIKEEILSGQEPVLVELEWRMPAQWPVAVNFWADPGDAQGTCGASTCFCRLLLPAAALSTVHLLSLEAAGLRHSLPCCPLDAVYVCWGPHCSVNCSLPILFALAVGGGMLAVFVLLQLPASCSLWHPTCCVWEPMSVSRPSTMFFPWRADPKNSVCLMASMKNIPVFTAPLTPTLKSLAPPVRIAAAATVVPLLLRSCCWCRLARLSWGCPGDAAAVLCYR